MILSDIKYAIRLLTKRPGFTILTTLVMTTGIGLSVYLFSFFNVMVFKALPFENGDTLVQMSASRNNFKGMDMINLHDYYEIRKNVKGLGEFGAYRNVSLNVSGRDGARRYGGIAAEPNVFKLTRTKPILGREFTQAENQPGAERVVVIGYDVWRTQFGGDKNIIDQSLKINGDSHRIIGVMPEGYFFPYSSEMWVPLREDATKSNRGDAGSVFGLAHLNPGITIEDVDKELAIIMQRLEQRFPKTNTGVGAYITTIPMADIEDGAPFIYSLHVVAVLILILAAINVANLLLARAIERGKETAIRVALGAPRFRLVMQMLWESVLICVTGGVIAVLLLAWGLEVTEGVTKSFFVEKPKFWWKFGVDSYTLSICIAFVIGTILTTGLLPAWKNSGADFNAVLRDGTRGALGKKAGRLNKVLVISEIFVSMTVLIAATVMSVVNFKATQADYGADPEGILSAQVLMTGSNYDTPEERAIFLKNLQARLENSTGIGKVMISSELPGEMGAKPNIAIEGREYTKDQGYPQANYISILPGALKKLGVELREGRYFNSGDDGLDKTTVVVTESFVERHFPNGNPIGKRIRNVEADGNTPHWLTIVGVVEHTIQGESFGQNSKTPSIFRPATQDPTEQVTVAMEMKAEKSDVTHTLRDVLKSIDPELPAFNIELYTQSIERYTAPLIFITTVILLFGVAAAVLATSGIYGVMSNTINQRTQEIGVKRALGADESRITKEFLMTGVKQLLIGGIPGVIMGCMMGVAMSELFPVGIVDLTIISLVIITIVGGAVIIATYVPTKRALDMEPSQALRHE